MARTACFSRVLTVQQSFCLLLAVVMTILGVEKDRLAIIGRHPSVPIMIIPRMVSTLIQMVVFGSTIIVAMDSPFAP